MGDALVVGRDQAMDALIEACPSFLAAEDLHAFQNLFEDGGDPDFFLRVAAFSQHIVSLIEQGRAEDLAPISDAVEAILVSGDRDAVELVELGLVEHLQNIVSHGDIGVSAAQVEALLGPRGTEVWSRVDALWAAAGVHARGARSSEEDYDRVDDPNLRLYFRAHTRALPDGRLLSSSDVYQQERRLVDRYRARQRAALRLIAAAALLAVVVLLTVAVRGR